MKFYRGSAAAARSYVEADRSRADDYYLAEGTGLATRYVATSGPDNPASVLEAGALDGPAYERWVAGFDVATGVAKGQLRTDERGLRFVEVVVNGPKTWSLAASLHPDVADAYDAAQEKAAREVIGWLAAHATTRVGPRGRQVQVPVDRLEAAVVRHYTSRAGDPHRHLHLQVNARVMAGGQWRGLHSVGVVDSIQAVNGIGHAAVACDPEFRRALAARGYHLDTGTGEVNELVPYAGRFSARAAQIARNIDRYEATWRTEHPGSEPDQRLRRTWDRRAWAQARPHKVTPISGADLAARWREELHDLGFTPPRPDPDLGVGLVGTAVGRVNRDAVADLVLTRLGARRSAWNAADIRGETEQIIAGLDVITEPTVRGELVEDLTTRARARCVPLLDRGEVPEHVRALTSRRVLDVETDLTTRLAARADRPATSEPVGAQARGRTLDPAQREAVGALGGTARLVVVEGAAGAGKTMTLAAARDLLDVQGHRLVVVTPTMKAAQVVQAETGADAFSAAWLAHHHGHRWDSDGHRWHEPAPAHPLARLLPGDLLVVDEAGMLDQDTAQALLHIADTAGARLALVGDPHQLPAVGRGGVLDHATRWAAPDAHVLLEGIHRFTDPDYAALTLLMRTGQDPAHAFDALHERGQVVLHPTAVERTAALARVDGLVIADTREQVAALNAAIRDHHRTHETSSTGPAVTTRAGETLSAGDLVATRRNNPDLRVANRDRWTITAVQHDGSLTVHGRGGTRHLPADYVQHHLELAYATTVHGAQGDTVPAAHFLLDETTGAAAAYVAMTRGRESNTAHLVADTLEDARAQWVTTFSRDRADLGPAHATHLAAEDIERYGPQPRPTQPEDNDILARRRSPAHVPSRSSSSDRSPRIGR
ncbi:MobF family relaxase [Phycicoccus sonneratiae]|uniref:AAA family ATPase n=1 Tax=Phycicoccus sonneratiae TaxID=2807628 RepID=A0ABS2CQU7_9MICO|nr:MobF family relaxase [Phycicoccus sonneraticus]MBM6401439.1 AAA family ATPase [Phycicoccus sonneraticus]